MDCKKYEDPKFLSFYFTCSVKTLLENKDISDMLDQCTKTCLSGNWPHNKKKVKDNQICLIFNSVVKISKKKHDILETLQGWVHSRKHSVVKKVANYNHLPAFIKLAFFPALWLNGLTKTFIGQPCAKVAFPVESWNKHDDPLYQYYSEVI